MKNKLPPKKTGGHVNIIVNKSDLTVEQISPVSPVPTTSHQQQQQQDISSLLVVAMSESRSSSPIALTTKPPGAGYIHNLHQQLHQLHQQAAHHLAAGSVAIGENLVPPGDQQHPGGGGNLINAGSMVVDQIGDHVAADALVNLSNQHASRQHANAMANAAHQLPPACGAKQLSKLKRFLTTLVQFGRDLAPEICDRVRLLILALVNNLINVEEFHSKLQDLTGYPLRPFVIPFLKANLPLLQRELAHCARLARQTPQQFLLSNESLVYAPFTPSASGAPNVPSALSPAINNKTQQPASSPTPAEPGDLAESPFDMSQFLHHQRAQLPPSAHRLRERSPDNVSLNSSRSSPPNPKRVRSRSPIGGNVPSQRSGPQQQQAQIQTPNAKVTNPTVIQPVAKNPSVADSLAWLQAAASNNQQQQHQPGQQPQAQLPPPLTSVAAAAAAGAAGILGDAGVAVNEEMWRLLDQQLSTLADAASNCRRSAVGLRERSREELLGVLARARIAGARLGVAGASQEVDEIRRRAEEAVNEIKRQACIELQRGVAAAEQKAREMVTAERARMMRELAEARQRGFDEANASLAKQEDLPENCANCGRSASERCSACEQVRYCGRFCQLHDWQRHRLHCRQFASGEGGPTNSRRPSSDADHQLNKDEKPPQQDQKEASNDGELILPDDSTPPPGVSSAPIASQDAQHHHRRSKHAAVKNESISPVIGAASTPSSSAGRSESRQSSANASCH